MVVGLLHRWVFMSDCGCGAITQMVFMSDRGCGAISQMVFNEWLWLWSDFANGLYE